MGRYIVDLKDNRACELSLSGGKGANLAKLSSIPGIPVPDGFIVSAQAYRDFVLSLPEVKNCFT